MTLTLLAADQPQPVAAWWQLILAALAGIALIVLLITVAKVHRPARCFSHTSTTPDSGSSKSISA